MLPAPGGQVVLLDVGANVEVRPEHLVQFALMGAAFSERVLGVERPRVGLLSVGEEPEKGTPDVVAAHEQLAGSGSFELHRERRRRWTPRRPGRRRRNRRVHRQRRAEADGGDGAHDRRRRSATRPARARVSKLGGLLLRPEARAGCASGSIPSAVGGAYLLGLRGLVVICHGNSSRRAIASAVALAARGVEQQVVDRTADALAAAGVLGANIAAPKRRSGAGSSVAAGSFRPRP